MAKIVINKEISKEAVLAVFQKFFAGRYEVYASGLIGIDFAVKKSGWTGCGVRVKPKGGQTTIVYNAFAPSALVRVLAMGLIPILILWLTSWKAMTAEVKGFLESAPELR
jgi:hypothetical protein